MLTERPREHGRQNHHSGLRFRIAIIVVLVAILPMAIVSGVILYRFNIFSNEMVYAHLEQLILKHKQSIDDFLNKKLSDISHFSRGYGLDQLRDKAFLQQKIKVLQEEYGFVFVDLGLIDENGRQVSYAGPFELEKADYSNSQWFQRAIRADRYVSDVFLGLRGQPHFIVAVKRQWEGSEWILRATIDFFAFNTLVENLSVGKTGLAFILNQDGEFQTRPPKGKLKLTKQQYLNLFKKGEEALLAQTRQPDDLPFLMESEAICLNEYLYQSPVFTVQKTTPEGDDFIIVAAFLKNSEWLLIFQQEFADAFSKLKRTQYIAGFISFLGAVGIILVALFVSSSLVKRIASLDREKEIMNKQVIETGKLASVGELAAGIAHEINNPVAIMVEEAGWIQDLLEEGIEKEDNLEEFKRALGQIENQGRRCKEITHKLLSFARKTDSRIQTLQLNDIITEVVGLLSQKSRFANADVEVETDPGLPTILGSITEMQQVFMNLLHNALDAMESTGGKIMITSAREEDTVRVSIRDTGPGIPESSLERVFDPFFTTKPVGKGTGLGLSICYGIVNKMGGRIEVESQVGKGTTFHIFLPVN
jgi:two-component system, NtrC family, sensor kinase